MQILVKVSDNHKSNIKLNDVEAYRALTVSDINIYLKRFGDSLQAVILEEPTEELLPVVKDVLNNYTAKIYTLGDVQMGDEEIVRNFTSLSDLQDRLDQDFNIHTKTYGNERSPVLYTEIKNPDGTPYVTKAERERIEAERIAKEKEEAERLEAERIAKEKEEAERLEAERIEAERIAKEKEEAERLEAERIEAERIAKEKEEAERLEAERLEAERLEAERLEAERLEAERLEAEKAEAERLEAERLEAERLEAEKAEAERLEAERLEAERLEAERLEAEKEEAERLEAERLEAERIAKEKEEAERLEAEKAEADSIFDNVFVTESVESEKSEEEAKDLPESDSIFAEQVSEEKPEEVKDLPESDSIFAEQVSEEKPEEVKDLPESDSIFAEQVLEEKSEEEVKDLPESDSIFTEQVPEEKPEEEVKDLPESDSTENIGEQSSTTEEEKGEIVPEATEAQESIEDTGNTGNTGNIDNTDNTEPMPENIDMHTVSVKSIDMHSFISALDSTLKLEDIVRFNSLGESEKDLVQAFYDEVVFYRGVMAKLATSEATTEYIESISKKAQETQDLANQVNLLLHQKAGIEEKIKATEEQLQEKSKISEELQEELDRANSKVDELLSEKEQLSLQIDATKADKVKAESKVSELENQVRAVTESKATEMASTIDEYRVQIDELSAKLASSLSEVSAKAEENTRLSESLDEKVASVIALMDLIKSFLSKKRSELILSERETRKVDSLHAENQRLTAENLEYKSKLDNSEIEHKRELQIKANELRQLNLKLDESVRAGTEAKEQVLTVQDENEKLVRKTETLQIQVDASIKQIEEQKSKLQGLLDEIEKKDTDIVAKDALLASKDRDLEDLRAKLTEQTQTEDTIRAKDYALSELNRTRGEESQRNRELDRVNKELESRIGKLSQEKNDLQTKVNALSLALKTGENVVMKCGYSGSGCIIPVFGSGSYGITLSAVSIARTLYNDGKNVLLMDLDLVAPKANAYLKANPLLPKETIEFAGLTKNEDMYRTSFGILLKIGFKRFLDDKDHYIQTIDKNKRKGNVLDYFSGLIGRLIASEFQAINWEEVLNYLGNQYDYIIMDLGRFGALSEQNMLINMFTSNTVAFKYLIVTTKDEDDMRMMLVKAQQAKLNMTRAVWMVNLAHDTEDTIIMQRGLGKIPRRIVTFNSGMYGSKKLFTDVIFKGQFSGIMDLLTGVELK